MIMILLFCGDHNTITAVFLLLTNVYACAACVYENRYEAAQYMADKLHAMVADSETFANDPQTAIHDAFLAADEEVQL
jgi:hypothetical protein